MIRKNALIAADTLNDRVLLFYEEESASLDELQNDVDAWITGYNEERPHNGEDCCGKTPMQTWIDRKHVAGEKMLDGASKIGPVR